MFCTNCGSKIDDGVNFCPNCGQPVKMQAESAVGEATAAATETVTSTVNTASEAVADTVNAAAETTAEVVSESAAETVSESVQSGATAASESVASAGETVADAVVGATVAGAAVVGAATDAVNTAGDAASNAASNAAGNVTAQYAQHISEQKAAQGIPQAAQPTYSGQYNAQGSQQAGTPNGQFNQQQAGAPNGQFNQAQAGTPNGQFNQTQAGTPNGQFNQTQAGTPNGQFNQAQAGTSNSQFNQQQTGAPNYTAPQPKDNINTIGQVFCIIALVLMLFQAFHVIGAFFGIFMGISAEGFLGFLYGVINFGVNALKFCGLTISALVMYLIWKKWDTDKAEPLVVGLLAGGIVIMGSVIIRMIVVSLFNFMFGYPYASMWSGVFLSFVFTVAMLAVTFFYTSGKQIDALGGLKQGNFTDNVKKDFKTVSEMAVQAKDEYKAGKNKTQYNTAAGQNGMNQTAGVNGQPGAGQPYNGQPNGVAGPLATDRSLVAYILLGLITCSIYDFYMLHCIIQDVNITCAGDGKQTKGILEYIVFGMLTCGIYDYIWLYNLGNRMQANAPRYGMNFQEGGTAILLWYVIGVWLCGIGPFVAMYIVIKNSNALNAAYNNMIAQQNNQ